MNNGDNERDDHCDCAGLLWYAMLYAIMVFDDDDDKP